MLELFLLTPLREGRHEPLAEGIVRVNFYSRPCGRGDFGLHILAGFAQIISTHAPAGGATPANAGWIKSGGHFYSRPCGRGDERLCIRYHMGAYEFLLTPLREGRRGCNDSEEGSIQISTHAPAGGATAIFHKSVMRFCGKLPKDDTVLCLASFGFPRRDPKAVYLAWISCANLPQKCVRQGLALKDQGTSCFHEGLASHAFDPVLV